MIDKLYAAIFLLMVIGATVGLLMWLDARIELKLRAATPPVTPPSPPVFFKGEEERSLVDVPDGGVQFGIGWSGWWHGDEWDGCNQCRVVLGDAGHFVRYRDLRDR